MPLRSVDHLPFCQWEYLYRRWWSVSTRGDIYLFITATTDFPLFVSLVGCRDTSGKSVVAVVSELHHLVSISSETKWVLH